MESFLCGRRVRGFTLLELMVVVVILGVLATVAVFSYKRYMRRARVQEGVAFLMDIKLKQETYFATYSQYVDTGTTVDDFYPADAAFKSNLLPVSWGWDCAAAGLTMAEQGFCALGLNPAAPETWFQYVTIGWAPGDGTPPADYIPDPSRRWWFARARTYWGPAESLPVELRLSSQWPQVAELMP